VCRTTARLITLYDSGDWPDHMEDSEKSDSVKFKHKNVVIDCHIPWG
jgi:hypothetical protein